jgi:uncharacterized SAM-binding protein YcdF (DUF218 family)
VKAGSLARLLCRPLELAPVEITRPAEGLPYWGPLVGEIDADAVVILGARLAGGAIGPVLAERIEVGVALWRRGLAPSIVVSGRGEARPMAARARELGVPDAALIVEDRARTTRENAERTAALIGRGARVLVVSQPFHLRRAVYLFERAGLAALPAAAGDSIQYRRPALALRWAIREYAAWLKVGIGL